MAEAEKEGGVDIFLMVFFTILFMPFGIVIGAWVTQCTWNWFAPVVYAQAPLITFVQAIAARAILGLLTLHQSTGTKNKTCKDIVSSGFVTTFFVPPFVLLFSWILHLFVHV